MAKTDSNLYLKDSVLPVVTDQKWAKILAIAGFSRRGDPTWSDKTKSLECVVVRDDIEVAMTVSGSYMHDQDGEWTVRAEVFSGGNASADRHGPMKFQPVDDAVQIMKAIVSVLGALS